ncbi:hypothetical protein GGD68_006096 [Paraburkholderia fungorum]|nr:hypothetical protein [Paraburkholderia fungorum]MBB4517293.1 hypothetical protein [Paraburkholderia fungorum]
MLVPMPTHSRAPLAVVGHLNIPPAALEHRFVMEALAVAHSRESDDLERVIGTDNTSRCELYGWAPHVAPHADGFGFVYLVCLNDGKSSISVRDTCGEIQEVFAPVGTVIRLDDRLEHWTSDTVARVAAFTGHFPEPCDEAAIEELEAGIAALAEGAYIGAPRVRDGFRVLLDDECWSAATLDDELETTLLRDATAAGRWIEICSHCRKPAARPDPKWPYSMAMSRCMEHLAAR